MTIKIKHKIIIACACLSTLAIIVTSLVVGFEALNVSSDAIEHRANQQLIAIRELKKNQAEDYFKRIRNQITTLAAAPQTLEASVLLSDAFFNHENEVGSIIDSARINQFYQDDFATQFKQKNQQHAPDISAIFGKLSDSAKQLQQLMLIDNPNPVGSKDALSQPDDASSYSSQHHRFHPWFRQYLNTFGFTIFLSLSLITVTLFILSTRKLTLRPH
jgi:methyl-accepting chemotaxis protein